VEIGMKERRPHMDTRPTEDERACARHDARAKEKTPEEGLDLGHTA
jgi:hypothetical protein